MVFFARTILQILVFYSIKNSGQDFSTEYMTDCFSDFWERGVHETVFGEDEKPGKIKDDGIGLIKTYHETVSPTIQPVQVFRASPSKLDFPLPTLHTLRMYGPDEDDSLFCTASRSLLVQ